ncbi:MAG: serine/threonine-protein phosphatase [Lentisphaeria bacterium]|nr:serine/threonine-protein phosphatase [Lentisphaeria bacterium]
MFNDAGFRFAGESISGLVRKNNEDSFLIAAPRGRKTALAVVADGVGGHRHGEIVSYISCRDLGRAFALSPDEELLKDGGAERFLADAVGTINRRVFKINYEEFAIHPMSSTLVAVLFLPERAVMLNVGDSRFYVIRPECGVEQISTDHTLANDKEFVYHEKRDSLFAVNTISRSIGSRYNLKVEIKSVSLKGGERFFMCTDGVYRDLSAEQIADVLNESLSPLQTVNRIMRSVLLNGAHDNTSAISVFPC